MIALHVPHLAVAVVTCATLWVVVFGLSVHEIALCALCAVQVSSLIGQSTTDVQHGAYGRAQEALLYSLHVVLLVPEVVVFLPCVEPDHHCYLNRPATVYLRFKNFAQQFFTAHTTLSIHTSMMIRCVQLTVAVLACVLCVFIIGPIACVIQCSRWVRSRCDGTPMSELDAHSIKPLCITAVITLAVAVLFTL